MSVIQIKQDDFILYNENYVSAEQTLGNWFILIAWFKTSTLVRIINDYIGVEVEFNLQPGTAIEEAVKNINEVFYKIYNEVII